MHQSFDDVSAQLKWLRDSLDRVLDSEMLDSDELNDWAVSASRVLFASHRQNGG